MDFRGWLRVNEDCGGLSPDDSMYSNGEDPKFADKVRSNRSTKGGSRCKLGMCPGDENAKDPKKIFGDLDSIPVKLRMKKK